MNIDTHTKLTVTSDERLEQDPSFYMTSSFEARAGDGTLLIAAPVFRELQIPLRAGEKVKVSFMDKTASYGFDAEVLERVQQDGLYYLRIRRLTDVVRVQRRQDFRLQVSLEGKLDQAHVDVGGERRVRRLPVRTKDVSGGGAFICLNSQLFVNETVVVYLPLGTDGEMGAYQAVVRWCARSEVQDLSWKWYTGLMFRHREYADKEALVRRIFTLQQQMRKREAEKEMR